MPKKPAIVFLVIVLLSGLFFPLVSLAGEYQVWQCKPDSKGNLPTGLTGDCTSFTATYDGFVPCGKCVRMPAGTTLEEKMAKATEDRCGKPSGGTDAPLYLNCQLCHFFVMIDDMLGFLLTKIIPPMAVLMLIIGGVMFYFGGAKPDLVTRGRKLIISVFIGLCLIYGSYMIVGGLLKLVGAANMRPVSEIYKHGVFSINCPIKIPKKQ